MEERNIDFGIELTRDQWQELTRRAAALGPEEGGFGWRPRDGEPIHVYLRDEDAPNAWRHRVSREELYGTPEREVARFHYNGGRPYAEILPQPGVDEPAYEEPDEKVMEAELETWTRGKWHELLRESGLHYERGHLPQE